MKPDPDHEQARKAIEAAWEQWPDRAPDSTIIYRFYCWARYERPELFDYRRDVVSDEQWQEVKGWLLRYESRRRVTARAT